MQDGNFSGTTLATVIRLILLSVVVGVVLSALQIRPTEIFSYIKGAIDWLYSLGFGAIEWLVQYFLVGAMIVVPVWLISRLFARIGSSR
jgi:Family of unknown function (DUF6460)